MPSWKRVILSGSDAALNSLTVTQAVTSTSFTGSLQGTASFATNSGDFRPSFRSGSFGITIDGAGSEITTGEKGYAIIPYNAKIDGWTVIADQVGDCVIDVWKQSAGNIPTSGDTIAGSELPTLSNEQIQSNLSLSTWITDIDAGDIIAFNVDSAATVTRVHLTIYITKL